MARALLAVQAGSAPQPRPKDRITDRDWEKMGKRIREQLSKERVITKTAVVPDSGGSKDQSEESEDEARGKQGRQAFEAVNEKMTATGRDRDFLVLSREEGYTESSSDISSPADGEKPILTKEGGLKMRRSFVRRGGRDPGEDGSSSSSGALSPVS
jgi:hypothetical protein